MWQIALGIVTTCEKTVSFTVEHPREYAKMNDSRDYCFVWQLEGGFEGVFYLFFISNYRAWAPLSIDTTCVCARTYTNKFIAVLPFERYGSLYKSAMFGKIGKKGVSPDKYKLQNPSKFIGKKRKIIKSKTNPIRLSSYHLSI